RLRISEDIRPRRWCGRRPALARSRPDFPVRERKCTMSTAATIILIVAVVVVIALVAWMMQAQLRRKRLRERFGPEYDRALEESGDRRAAERQLADRQKPHAQLHLKSP